MILSLERNQHGSYQQLVAAWAGEYWWPLYKTKWKHFVRVKLGIYVLGSPLLDSLFQYESKALRKGYDVWAVVLPMAFVSMLLTYWSEPIVQPAVPCECSNLATNIGASLPKVVICFGMPSARVS